MRADAPRLRAGAPLAGILRAMRHLIPAFLGAVIAGCATAPLSTGEKHSCYHANEPVEVSIGYCEAVRVGDKLYVSGTVGAGEMPAAVRQAYSGLRKTLEANGLTFANVVKENVYTTDIDAFKKTGDIRKGFYGSNLPAATWVEVRRLFLPQFVVEIEVVAEYR